MITVPSASQVYTPSRYGPCVTGEFSRVMSEFNWCRVVFEAEYIEFDMMWVVFHDAKFTERSSYGGWKTPVRYVDLPGIHRIPSRLIRDITFDACTTGLALTG